MSRSLFSLIIRTRFTTAYLVLFGLLLAYAFAEISFFPPKEPIILLHIFGYIVLGILVLFTIIYGLNSSYPIIRSDTDFLFTSPVSKRAIAFALYTSKYLFIGIIFLISNLYIVGLVAPVLLDRVFVIVDTIVASILITSLSISVSKYTVRRKILALVAVSGWELFSLLGFGFSPASYIFGDIYSGTAMLVALTSLLTFYAYVQLKNADIDTLKLTISGAQKSERAKKVSTNGKRVFDNTTPGKAMLIFNLTKTSIVSSRRTFSSERNVGVHKGLGIFALIGVGTLAGVVLFLISYFFHMVAGIRELYIFVGMYSLMFLYTFAYNALSSERAWVSFTSIKPAVYIRYVIYGRMIRSLAITGPIGISVLFIYLVFHLNILGLAVVEFIDAPMMVILLIMTTMVVGVFQIKDPEFITPQRNAKQILYAPVSIGGMIIGGVSAFFFMLSVYVALGVIILSLIFLFYPKILNFAVFRMTEKGFS
ncbi:MAG: hypothetical protein LVQ96_01725 [Thermoplasmatales archaeon]|nr:hypothetical protein [Thermoplasmatales archaeon]MCW6169873.1 hypothetical protein [Thermoplasmatales archaeon]